MQYVPQSCRKKKETMFINYTATIKYMFLFFMWRCNPTRVMASSFLRFLDHTQRRATVGRTPLDEWSARRRDLYLTTNDNHNRQISMPPVGFEPTISVGERPQTNALDCAATGTGIQHICWTNFVPDFVPFSFFPHFIPSNWWCCLERTLSCIFLANFPVRK